MTIQIAITVPLGYVAVTSNVSSNIGSYFVLLSHSINDFI